jgi:hypothetical protein
LLEQGWPQDNRNKTGEPHFVGARLASGHQAFKPWLKKTGGPHSVVSSQLKNRWATVCWSKVGLKPKQAGHTFLEQGWHQAN